LKIVTLANCEIPKKLVLRQLDDLAIVAPNNTNWCEQATESYKKLCQKVGVELAKNCKLKEKAFENEKRGKVLGILFDSTDLTWALPRDKVFKCISAIMLALESKTSSLLSFQKLMGRIIDICQMCPFMRIFKQPLNKELQIEEELSCNDIHISDQAKSDLMIWAGFLLSEFHWLPICPLKSGPPLRCTVVCSDAAGLAEGESSMKEPGCGSIALCEEGKILTVRQFLWPSDFIQNGRDDKKVRFGDKSTTLEMIGMVLVFLSDPSLFRGKRVLLKVDNLAAVFGMETGSIKNDENAAVFVRTLHLIAAYLECELFIEHLPRKSDWESLLVDRLSRKSTTTKQDQERLLAFGEFSLPKCLENWFSSPSLDWQLSVKLLEYVECIV